jgi:small subunit ribosomal protein S3Ae
MAKGKIQRKQWFPILAPKMFRNAVLGETLVYGPQSMMGKGITQSLMNLTNDVKRQNVKINFEVVDVQDNKAFTEIIGYNIVPSSVRRMVRRNIEKIDMSFLCRTSDNKTLRIKPLLIARSAIKGSISANLNNTAKEFLLKYSESVTYDNFVNDMISHKLQSSLRAHLNRIYPLRVCEIRSMEIIDEKKNMEGLKAKPETKADKVHPQQSKTGDASAKTDKKGEVSEEAKSDKKEEDSKEAKTDKKGEDSKEAKPDKVENTKETKAEEQKPEAVPSKAA